MTDRETIAIYDDKAADYADLIEREAGNDPHLDAFLAACEPGGRLLDLGCGPGLSAARMAVAGFRVDAVDASARMVELAAAHPGVTAWQARFDDITGADVYDGIWANFCLLHAPRAALPGLLSAFRTALKPRGLFHVAVKLGEGEARDALGRLYTYFPEAELEQLLQDAGLTPVFRAYGRSAGLSGEEADWIVMRARA